MEMVYRRFYRAFAPDGALGNRSSRESAQRAEGLGSKAVSRVWVCTPSGVQAANY